MSSLNAFPAHGSVKEIAGDKLVFNPLDTNYELRLKPAGPTPPADPSLPVAGLIQVTARKLWTVPSGGNFIAPIFGEPRTIQGRVKWLDETTLVLQAGTTVIVKLPASQAAIDLANGGIEIGALVNVTALPGATFELQTASVGSV